jgi:hypothetical protein
MRAEGTRSCSLGRSPRMRWRSQMRAEGPRYTRCHAAIAFVRVGAFGFQHEATQTVPERRYSRRDARLPGFGSEWVGEYLCAGGWGCRSRSRCDVSGANRVYVASCREAEGIVVEVDQDQGAGVCEVRMATWVCGVFRRVERSGGVGAVHRCAGDAPSAARLPSGDAGDVREIWRCI